MRYERLLPLALVAMFGLAACDNGAQSDGDQAMNDDAATEQDSAAREDNAMAESAQPETQVADSMDQRSSEEVALTVEESTEHGQYVADDDGRAVYMLEADSSSQSNCNDDCAQEWPPVVADSGKPTAEDPAIEESKISTIQRDDGKEQVTYNGHPLYYYAKDQGPGQATGQEKQDRWGEWYLVNTQGEQLEPQDSRSRQPEEGDQY